MIYVHVFMHSMDAFYRNAIPALIELITIENTCSNIPVKRQTYIVRLHLDAHAEYKGLKAGFFKSMIVRLLILQGKKKEREFQSHSDKIWFPNI